MTLVDTNVISELMRPHPNQNVVGWLDAQLAETLYVSAVSLAEIVLGIALLSDGPRKSSLDRSFALHEGRCSEPASSRSASAKRALTMMSSAGPDRMAIRFRLRTAK